MKDTIFDTRVNNSTSFSVMYVEYLGFSSVGLVLGLLIDNFFKWFGKGVTCIWRKVMILFLQISMGAVVLASLAYVTRSLNWEEHWQASTPGMAFSAFYFGIQQNIFQILHELFVMK